MAFKHPYRKPSLWKGSTLYLFSIVILFFSIGIFTSMKPAYRITSDVIQSWTSDMDGSVFSHILAMENKAFQYVMKEEHDTLGIASLLFEVATSIKPNDPRSLLGNEIPGFSIYDRKIFIAGTGTDYTNLPFESSPPLEEVLKEREAVFEEEELEQDDGQDEGNTPSTGGRDVVFIYNTHNRESFLPHLPGVNDPNKALHHEVNITLVSERLAKSLEAKGIGAQVDKTDFAKKLSERNWEYWRSYEVSRESVVAAFNNNKDLQYVFDLHRDGLGKKHTTAEINGESYAKIMFVIGEDHPNMEKNLELATELHYLVEEKYPGLSRGVIPQGGSGNNGVYNQDLSEHALLIEIGGVENHLNELYRTADALAEVFSDYYWDVEEVDANP